MTGKMVASIIGLMTFALSPLSDTGSIPAARAQTPRYAVTMIPGLIATGVNDQGQVIGDVEQSQFADNPSQLWDHGHVTVLHGMSHAHGINSKGQIVGAMHGYHAALWDGGRLMDLGTLGGEGSEALAINDVGQVVGWSQTASGEPHPFLWENGKMRDLGTLPGHARSEATAINAKGQIVGGGGRAALLWQGGIMQDLGPLPGGTTSAIARGINDRGQILGILTISGQNRCFLWESGETQTFGLPGEGCQPEGINNNGQVVGWVPGQGGFLWEQGKMQKLLQLTPPGSMPTGVDTAYAFGINNRGQIIVHLYGYASALLTPTK